MPSLKNQKIRGDCSIIAAQKKQPGSCRHLVSEVFFFYRVFCSIDLLFPLVCWLTEGFVSPFNNRYMSYLPCQHLGFRRTKRSVRHKPAWPGGLGWTRAAIPMEESPKLAGWFLWTGKSHENLDDDGIAICIPRLWKPHTTHFGSKSRHLIKLWSSFDPHVWWFNSWNSWFSLFQHLIFIEVTARKFLLQKTVRPAILQWLKPWAFSLRFPVGFTMVWLICLDNPTAVGDSLNYFHLFSSRLIWYMNQRIQGISPSNLQVPIPGPSFEVGRLRHVEIPRSPLNRRRSMTRSGQAFWLHGHFPPSKPSRCFQIPGKHHEIYTFLGRGYANLGMLKSEHLPYPIISDHFSWTLRCWWVKPSISNFGWSDAHVSSLFMFFSSMPADSNIPILLVFQVYHSKFDSWTIPCWWPPDSPCFHYVRKQHIIHQPSSIIHQRWIDTWKTMNMMMDGWWMVDDFSEDRNITGWWFGTCFGFFPYIGFLIIPTDFHIFQRGCSTTNQ